MKKSLVVAVSSVAAAILLSGASSAVASEVQADQAGAPEDPQSAYGSDEWRYNTYYLFPLTRHMSDSELPKYGQYISYPLAAALDIAQLPIGALGGLIGE